MSSAKLVDLDQSLRYELDLYPEDEKPFNIDRYKRHNLIVKVREDKKGFKYCSLFNCEMHYNRHNGKFIAQPEHVTEAGKNSQSWKDILALHECMSNKWDKEAMRNAMLFCDITPEYVVQHTNNELVIMGIPYEDV